MAKEIQLTELRKEYHTEDTIVAVDDLSATIPEGSFTTLVGPSGCGKTTTLRMIAGLESPTSGKIRFGGTDVTDSPPQDRNISMVFQNIALYPHMTVRQNIGYGLRLQGMSKSKRNEQIEEAAKVLQIEDQLDKQPADLSGGQQQRVALGSVFVEDPEIILLDEPMSDLDAKLKAELRVELQRLHQQLDATVVYVTHDQTEAMTMSDYVALLNNGSIEQFAPPSEIFDEPTSEYAATFMGTPSTNIIECEITRGSDGVEFAGPGFSGRFPTVVADSVNGDRLKLGIRPQYLSPSDGEYSITVTIEVIEPLGTESVIHARTLDGDQFDIVTDEIAGLSSGDEIAVTFDADDIFIFNMNGGAVYVGSESERKRHHQ